MALFEKSTLMAASPELDDLFQALLRPSALMELGLVAGAMVLAWLLVRGLSRRAGPLWRDSVLLGDHVIDGVLFPILALLLAYCAQIVLRHLGVPLAVFRLAIPVLVSLLLIRLAARVLHAAFPTSAWVKLVERSVSWLAWLWVALWVTGLLPALLEELDGVRWKFGGTVVSLRTLLEGGVTATVVMMMALWLAAALERRLLVGPVEDLSMRKIAANLLRAGLLFFGLLFAMSAVGIDLTALSVLGGALGVGLGFGLQKLAANYVSGFVILAERSLRIGDMVRVDGFEGRITDIATRYTVIRALNGRESVVPNEMLISQRVENLSLADRSVQASTSVQVAYGTDLTIVMPSLVSAVREVARVQTEPPPAVLLSGFAADGLELSVVFWIDDPENGLGGVKSDVNLAVLGTLNNLGIDIPYPQRVVRQG